MVVREFSENDYETHSIVYRDILEVIFPTSVLICSDEAHFHLLGMVIKENFHHCSERNSRQLQEQPHHSAKVTVRCAMGNFGLWCPKRFEEEGATVTGTSGHYFEMLEKFFV